MRKHILLPLLILAGTASIVSAAGTNLRWAECADDGGVINRSFACSSNEGSRNLVGSFVLDSDLPQVSADELIVDLASAGATLPDWWHLWSLGSCRQLALTIAAHDGFSCPDPFQLQASMNIANYVVGRMGPNTARLLCVNAVPSNQARTLIGGQEYGVAKWSISNINTVGTGACGGCVVPVCMVFTSANITTVNGLDNTLLANAASPGSNMVSWQGGEYLYLCQGVPTRNSTWGAVKSLYR